MRQLSQKGSRVQQHSDCYFVFQYGIKGVVCEIQHRHTYSRHSSYVECNDISTRSLRSFDNLLFKFNVSLPLVIGELLQKTVDVNNVTYKLHNIKI